MVQTHLELVHSAVTNRILGPRLSQLGLYTAYNKLHWFARSVLSMERRGVGFVGRM